VSKRIHSALAVHIIRNVLWDMVTVKGSSHCMRADTRAYPRQYPRASVLMDGLDVPQRVIFKLCMTVYHISACMAWHRNVPRPPVRSSGGCCRATSAIRSASGGLLNFPRYHTSNCGRRAFCFAAPYVWNSLPGYIRHLWLSSSAH